MMPLSKKETKAIHAEIERISSTEKMLFKPALHVLLDLISSFSGGSHAEILHGYLAHVKVAEGVEKVF